METWNLFVYALIEAQKRDEKEAPYHELIENQLGLLGWAKYKNEIHHKPNLITGHGRIQPDILIKSGDENQFVIEVKRPVYTLDDKDCQQLISYMLQLQLRIGVYIGDHIEIFYNQPDNEEKPISVFKVNFELDSKKGEEFVRLFSKETFNKKYVAAFCEERIQEMQRKESLNRIKHSLMDKEGEMQIYNSVRQYLLTTYGDRFTESAIDEMLSTLVFRVEEKNEKQNERVHQIIPLDVDSPHSSQKRDTTKYSFNGGAAIGKGRLVLAIVSEYVRLHPEKNFEDLLLIFPPKWQGGYGIIRTTDDIVQNVNDPQKRYFMQKGEILADAQGKKFAVCTQWGDNWKRNGKKIMNIALQNGWTVEELQQSQVTKTTSSRKSLSLSDKSNIQKEFQCFLNRRNLNVKGVFNIEEQTLVVLKGSVINSKMAPSLRPAEIRRREVLVKENTINKNGNIVVQTNVKFNSPSGAALFCIGAASNGWDEWKDAEGMSLQNYRKR